MEYKGIDLETRDLDATFARFILPRIKRFKELSDCHPEGLTEKKWDDIIDKMIIGFEVMADPEKYYTFDPNGKEDARIAVALKLFCKHVRDLWW